MIGTAFPVAVRAASRPTPARASSAATASSQGGASAAAAAGASARARGAAGCVRARGILTRAGEGAAPARRDVGFARGGSGGRTGARTGWSGVPAVRDVAAAARALGESTARRDPDRIAAGSPRLAGRASGEVVAAGGRGDELRRATSTGSCAGVDGLAGAGAGETGAGGGAGAAAAGAGATRSGSSVKGST
jgi:hypothetical protein